MCSMCECVSGHKLKSSASGKRITDVGCDLRVLESIYAINGKPEPYFMCNEGRKEIVTYYCTACLPWIKHTADLYSRSLFLTTEMLGLKVNYLHVSCNHHLSWLDAQHQNPPSPTKFRTPFLHSNRFSIIQSFACCVFICIARDRKAFT